MPTYAYVCTECDHSFEAVQAITDDSLTECPSCGGTLRKKFHPVGVTFKGSGFYRTDSRGGASASAGSSKESTGGSGAGTSKETGGSSKDSGGASTAPSKGSDSSGSSSSGSSSSGSSPSGSSPSSGASKTSS